MKNIISIFLFLTIASISHSQTIYNQTARLSIWLMRDSTNLTSDRGGFCEILFSDTFTTGNKRAQFDETEDNIMILKPTTQLWRECRKYPQTVGAFDTVKLAISDFSQGQEWLHFSYGNFPENDFLVYLYDSKLHKYTSIRRKGERSLWIKFDTDDDISRRMILIKRLYK